MKRLLIIVAGLVIVFLSTSFIPTTLPVLRYGLDFVGGIFIGYAISAKKI